MPQIENIFQFVAYNMDDCKNRLTPNWMSSKMITVIALQIPVRPATGGEPAGSPLFILGVF